MDEYRPGRKVSDLGKPPPAQTVQSASPSDLHKPCPGQTETLCDLYINVLRGIIEHQSRLIADLQRRVAGEPVTWTWIDGVMQEDE